MNLVLFDIDGTLLRSGGGGRGAMSMAAQHCFGRPDLFDDVSFAGAVDLEVTGRALAQAGFPPTPRRIGRMRATYLRCLRRSLDVSAGSLCPGVPDVFERIEGAASIGLVTGNWPEGARIKLDVYGIGHFFEGCPGAYGDDAIDRDDLLPIAVRRARRKWGDVHRVLLVGDTPADISCARAGAAKMGMAGPEVIAVGVKTGFSDSDSLLACGPDLLLDDLQEGLPQLLEAIQSGVGR